MGGRPVGWKRPLEDRFWAYTDTSAGPTQCWPWTGPRIRGGYGRIIVSRRVLMATHVSLTIAGTPVPKGLQACHRCDNPPCVNPAHLFLGTAKDNRMDMAAKGRGWTGPRSDEWKAKQRAGLRAFFDARPRYRETAVACKWGHAWDDANTWRNKDGQRHCRACNRERAAERWRTDKRR